MTAGPVELTLNYMWHDLAAALDAYRRTQPNLPCRPEAVWRVASDAPKILSRYSRPEP